MKKGIPTHVFEQSCDAAARTFGKKHDISVVFAGTEAKTDGSTIWMPALPQGKDLTEEQVSVGRGYVDHEAGHIKHTDNELYGKAVKEAMMCNDKYLPVFMNALEDVRIERIITDEYSGSKRNLEATATAVNRAYKKAYDKDSSIADDDRKVGAVAITWEGRRRLGYNSGNEECLDTLPDDIRKQVENWTDMVDGMRDTKDMITAAISVADMVRKNNGEPEMEEVLTNVIFGDGSKRGAKTGKEVSAKNSDGNKSQGDSKSGKKKDKDFEQGGHEAGDPSVTSVDPIDPSLDIEDVLVGEKMPERHGNRNTEGLPFRILSTSSDKYHHASDPKNKYMSDYHEDFTFGSFMADEKGNAKYKSAVSKMSSSLGVMRRKLERALMATQLRGWDSGHEVGKLDTKRLVNAYQGYPNVFKIKESIKEIDTAVTILVDHSGSMHGDKMRLAMQACIGLTESVYKTGCELEILGFSTQSDFLTKVERKMYYEDETAYGRREPTDMFIYKSFKDRIQEARKSLGNMLKVASRCGGANADGCSVLQATRRLLKQRQKRKVLLVLSDGYPASRCDLGNKAENNHLRNAVQYTIDNGVDVIGIGIASEAVKQFYPDHAVIHDFDDLPKAVMDKIAKRLLGQRFVIDNADLIKADKQKVRQMK